MEEIIEQLRGQGYRLTRQRQQVLAVLSNRPQSVGEVVTALKTKDLRLDKVTVYRTLDCFVKLGAVNATQFRNQTTKYELATQPHHHHLICDQCGSVQDIPMNEASLIKQANRRTGFIIRSHTLEFYGLCVKCR